MFRKPIGEPAFSSEWRYPRFAAHGYRGKGALNPFAFALPALPVLPYLFSTMSEATFPRVIAKPGATVTVVRTGPFVIRHLAAGKPFLVNRNGRYELVYPQDSGDVPALRFAEHLRYRFNAWLVARGVHWHVPLFDFSAAFERGARKQAAATNARSNSQGPRRDHKRTPVRIEVKRLSKAIGRSILVVGFCFMALMGATRFVHVDVQAVLQSVHFSIPHFLTPWRRQVDPINEALSGGATSFPRLAYAPDATPASFAMPDTAGTGKAATADASDVAKPSHAADKGWIPLPGGGPLPANMPTYGASGAVRLSIHRPVFISPDETPDEDSGEDSVRLLSESASVALAGTELSLQPAPGQASLSETGHVVSGKETRKALRALAVHSARESDHQTAHEKSAQQQPQQRNPSTVDVQLMPTSTPDASSTDDESPTVQAAPTRRSNTNLPVSPEFDVVTKNGASLIVVDHGQMEQVSVGQSLPDGSTLLSVPEHGGGFTTSRGSYVAY